MRPLPEPMDGEAARPPRSTDDTARIPVMDDDAIGRHEAAGAPGWYDRLHVETHTRHPEHPAQRVAPRHRQAAKNDLPGPSRAELARLVRQVRALVIVLLVLFVGLHAYALYGLIIG